MMAQVGLLFSNRYIFSFSILYIMRMLVLPGTLTLKVKSINSNWSITGLSGSLPTDSEIHLALEQVEDYVKGYK
jgi:uncharacterized protein YaiE (UPF0345 family)